uniref:Uncharacterized protein n=1 Tax=Oryza barthii TaxID=65489 RepID=A0A0D3GSG5_9ORYZ
MAGPTIVLLPAWGSGHFMSALEAGKRLLVASGGAVSLTVLVMQAPTEIEASVVEAHVRREAASGLDVTFRRLPAVEHPTGCEATEEFMSRYVERHAHHVKAAIAGLASPVAAVVVDLFFTPLLDAAHELSIPAWAPQKDILAHAAVGGFVTHCGWNSVLESLWFGVPMATWPLYGEQHLNAFEAVASMGVAVELRRTTAKDGDAARSLVEAAEVERAVRRLMAPQGGGSSEAREKAAEVSAACRKAVEEGGSSHAALQRLVREIVRVVAGHPMPE